MNKSNNLLVLSVWGMELSWLYATATFVMMAAFSKPFPFGEGFAASCLAMVLTYLTQPLGWRRIQRIAVQVIGLAMVCLRLIYVLESPSYSFLGRYWIVEFLSRPKTLLQWLFFLVALLWLIFFWVGGFKIAKQPKNFGFVRNRFDLGVGVFLTIFLIELIIIVKTGIHLEGLMTEMLMLSFFIFGLLAFTFIRNSGHGLRHFVSGYRSVGTVLSFTGTILFIGTGAVMLFLPHLTRAAQTSFDLIKAAAAPLGPVIIKIILFIFRPRRDPSIVSDPSSAEQMQDAHLIPELGVLTDGRDSLLFQIVGWGLFSIFVVLLSALIAYLVWRLIQWLFSKQPQQKVTFRPWRTDLIHRLWMFILSSIKKLVAWTIGPQTALQLYKALLSWGHFSGMTHSPCETPLEYGNRLGDRFPLLQNEIHQVIEVHSKLVYGSHATSLEMISPAQSALRKLRSPTNWPSRIKSLIRH
jgi:hypothetical protein